MMHTVYIRNVWEGQVHNISISLSQTANYETCIHRVYSTVKFEHVNNNKVITSNNIDLHADVVVLLV